MTKRLDVLRCEICGNIVQVLHSGVGELVCCSMPMKLLEPKINDKEFNEKHVPIFKDSNIYVGEVIHPMTDEHHIEFIEAISDDKKNIEIKFLALDNEPVMNNVDDKYSSAIEYCNLHGLWSGNK